MTKVRFDRRRIELALTVLSFAVFFIITLNNLTHASIWFDEAVEYWYSKDFYGILPWNGTVESMYSRIITTYQPPLYNVIMHFWLLIADNEFWFRFSGVFFSEITTRFSASFLYK